MLVDWDSTLLAPCERDLWEMPQAGMALSTHSAMTGARPAHDLLRLYRACFHLAQIAIYTHHFRQPHVGDLNDATAWDNFMVHLPTHATWPDVAPP